MTLAHKYAFPASFVLPLIDNDEFAFEFRALVTLFNNPKLVARETGYVQRVFERFRERVDLVGITIDASDECIEVARRDLIIFECVEDLRLESVTQLLIAQLRDPSDDEFAHQCLRRAIEDFKTRSINCDMATKSADADIASLDRAREIIVDALDQGDLESANEGFREWRVTNSRLWFNLRDRCFFARVNARDLASCDRDRLIEIVDDLRKELVAENRRGRKPDPAADKFAREMVDIWLELTGKSWTAELKAEQGDNPFLRLLDEAGRIVDPNFNPRTRAENARQQMPKERKKRSRTSLLDS